MSKFTELASKVQAQQIDSVKQSQDAFLKMVESFSSNVPATPDVEIPEQVKEALKPAYEFFGTPEDVKAYLSEATNTWTKLGQDFQNAVVAQLTKNA